MTGEVVIIGGGPAGASAACLLARSGQPVRLLERDVAARHKICGEFVSIEAQACLADLGIDIAKLGAAPIEAVRLVHGLDVAETTLPFRAYGLSRKVMDEAILRQAVACGVSLARGVPVRAVRLKAGGHMVEATGLGEIRAETLFLATGKHEVQGVRRPLCGDKDELIGFKMHFALRATERAALENTIEIILFEGGYAGLQMIEDETANLCLLVARDRFERAGKTWNSLVADLCAETPHLSDRLNGARPLFDKPRSIFQVPYGFVHQPGRSEPPGLFRLGDQAGVIQSFAGDGMAIALHSGRLAAAAFLAKDAATDYHRKMRRDITGQIRLASLLYRAGRSRPGRRALLGACRLWPGALQLAAAWTRLPRSTYAS